MSSEAEERPVYAIRFSAQAEQDVTEAVLRRVEITGDAQAAGTWRNRLLEESGTLAQNPRRFARDAQASGRFGSETRRLLFRPTPDSAAYHVFFIVMDETPDGPRVQILHVRHASRRPLTREEARRILANQ